ncbi:MAG: hypothetical protein HYY20_09035 [Candidatus Tectomicrobia bacterium]|uniref:Uncharacterized protein n=1 Tax=Tectimicrobiota bacterium TaxID=2528274 RepID=A0A932CPZ9_UNCTE|nr:hypothetical protein [Candidatus Tectomicrobia bacterium]
MCAEQASWSESLQDAEDMAAKSKGKKEEIEERPSRPLTDEERYFFEHSYKEPVESIARIEETAKFLVGATATTSGLFLAAFKLSLGSQTVSSPAWFVPFLCWAISILGLVLVLFPQEYRTG